MAINAQTSFCFLLGNPVSHSLSPLIHNTGYQALGLNAVYLAAQVDPSLIGEAVNGLKALSAMGANVTSPYKEAVIPHLVSVSVESRHINAVNTIVNRSGMLHGYSTDGEGFCKTLLKSKAALDPENPILVIGAGGSARAIAYSLAGYGFKRLCLANRTLAKVEQLARLITASHVSTSCQPLALDGHNLITALSEAQLVVYCLPTDAAPVLKVLQQGKSAVAPGTLFFDLRYKPLETAILNAARLAGARAVNGLGLLLEQALLSFELLTGQQAPADKMVAALNSKAAPMEGNHGRS